jgi:L-glyceraldehyde 3-phosphate reductase
MGYEAAESRYQSMNYRRCGRSGLKFPAISLGLWHNFGQVDDFQTSRSMILKAFDLGITHFDLANNYGPPPGSAEETFGKILKQDLSRYRDELLISTKAGYLMWPGPYGEWGSRKYLLASLDQSLKRMGLDYVDIFYSHRPDTDTPMEETMGALESAVRQGKALYVGVSSYTPQQTDHAASILKNSGVPALIHQPNYSLLYRQAEGLFDVLEKHGMGFIAFCPLAQGLLTNRYLNGIPSDSRAGKPHGFLKPNQITETVMEKIRRLNKIAADRKQTLAQMALVWVLRHPQVTSALIGASSVKQIQENIQALENSSFSDEELNAIENATNSLS